MDYEGWQISNKVSLSENVRQAIDVYIRKHGTPPNVLETPLKNIPLPDGIVVRWINLPPNILLVGKVEETLIQP